MSGEQRLGEMPLMAHLFELRDRIVRAALAIVVAFVPLAFYATEIYGYFIKPVISVIPNNTMIATQIASQFLAPLTLAFYGALFIAAPVVIYQLWAFVAPGLYKHEKRLAIPLLVSAVLLFYLGAAFAYFIVVPTCIQFFGAIQLDGVKYMPDISFYMDFALFMFLAFGVSFEVPVILLILVRMGVVTTAKLSEWRGYIVLIIFIVAAILTPPDAISQTMMAVPMWLLYEAGLLLARVLEKRKKRDDEVVSD